MSLKDCRGYAYAIRELMQQSKDEIDRGERKGADRRWSKAHPRIKVGWFALWWLRGDVKRHA